MEYAVYFTYSVLIINCLMLLLDILGSKPNPSENIIVTPNEQRTLNFFTQVFLALDLFAIVALYLSR